MSENAEIVTAQEPEIEPEGQPQAAVAEPGKLMRIALMLKELQEEVRRADIDVAGRDRLRHVHDRAVRELCGVLSNDLQQELSELTLPFDDGTPSESEIRIAQAQLIGWLEGLFQGIQAAMFTQQAQARQQFEEMRRRGLPSGVPAHDQREPGETAHGTGQYL